MTQEHDLCPDCTYGDQLRELLTIIEKRRKQLHDRGDVARARELDAVIGKYVAQTVLKNWGIPEISLA